MNTKYQIISTTFSHPLIFVLEAEAGELLELSRVQDQPEQHNKASSDKEYTSYCMPFVIVDWAWNMIPPI